MTTPFDLTDARAALAATEAPAQTLYSWVFACAGCSNILAHVHASTSDKPPSEWETRARRCDDCQSVGLPDDGLPCVTGSTWEKEPDQEVDVAHLRAALAEVDRLTQIAQAALKRWRWAPSSLGEIILYFHSPAEGERPVGSLTPGSAGIRVYLRSYPPRAPFPITDAALVYLRGLLGADVPDLPPTSPAKET